MSQRYVIDSSHHRLLADWVGPLTAVELTAFLREIEADPEFHDGLDRVCDLRQASIDLPTGQLRDIAEIERVLAERGCYRKTAVVVADDLSYGMMRMITSMADLAEATYQIFHDFETALDWLRNSGGETAPSFEDGAVG